MMSAFRIVTALLFLAIASPIFSGDGKTPSAKEALQPFNTLIGKWKGTGEPKGPGSEKTDFWIESMDWEWQFKGNDAWLKVVFEKSRNFISGELRFDPVAKNFQLTLRTPAKDSLVFVGAVKDTTATFERQVKEEAQRIVFSLLHPNRILYRFDVRAPGRTLFAQQYRVGATKEGVTTPVTYQGATYYVCCSGCRIEFNENPEKYIKEYQAKKAKKK
jgi:YHS domain-containing protein